MKTHSNTEAINSIQHFQSQSVCVMLIHRHEPSLSSSFGTHFLFYFCCFHSSICTSSCEYASYTRHMVGVPVKPRTTPHSFIFSKFFCFGFPNQKPFIHSKNLPSWRRTAFQKTSMRTHRTSNLKSEPPCIVTLNGQRNCSRKSKNIAIKVIKINLTLN